MKTWVILTLGGVTAASSVVGIVALVAGNDLLWALSFGVGLAAAVPVFVARWKKRGPLL